MNKKFLFFLSCIINMGTVSAMEMEIKPASIELIPTELSKKILDDIIATSGSIQSAAESIRALSRTNKNFHAFVNKPETTEKLIKKLKDKYHHIKPYITDDFQVAVILNTPGAMQWVKTHYPDWKNKFKDFVNNISWDFIKPILKTNRAAAKVFMKRGTNTLCTAIDFYDSEMVELLIKNGANIDAEFDNKCPLKTTIEIADVEMIKKLLAAGAKNHDYFFTFFLNQKRFNFPKSFLKDFYLNETNFLSRLNGNLKDRLSSYFAGNINKPIAQLLLEKGTNPNYQNPENGDNLLLSTIQSRNIPVLEILLNHPDIRLDLANPSSGENALMVACAQKDASFQLILKKILETKQKNMFTAKDKRGRTALMHAVEAKNHAALESLCLHSDVNAKNNNKYTPLIEAVYNKDHIAMEILLKHGADAKIKTEGFFKQSALDIAKHYGDEKCIKLLEEHLKKSITQTYSRIRF